MRHADFKREVNTHTQYPESLRQEFEDYWTEPNKSGTKMKFEMEKTWHLGRRLARWANSPFQGVNGNKQGLVPSPVKAAKIPVDDFDRLDIFLMEYINNPTGKRFEDFGKWYDFMKTERLLMPLTKEKIEDLKTVYNNDNQKCRCACVQISLDEYAKSGWTIFRTMQTRKRLEHG